MNIKINHIAKIEGHTGFMASVLQGDVKSAKFEVQEGVRLIEGILIGRHYKDMPIIAQRICGICPVVHNLTSIKAIENAMKVEVSEETKKLRQVMEHAQFIHSHALHLFFLSLADFLDIENDLDLIKEYPEETKKAIKIREFGMEMIKLIGGRVVHPMRNEIGGFKKAPTLEEIQKLISMGEEIMPIVLELAAFFATIKTPNFSRPTEYISMHKSGEYAIYDGDIMSNKGLNISAQQFEENFHEFQRPKEIVKRVKRDGKTSYMVGAIARVNNGHAKLSPAARNFLQSLNFNMPDYNPFHNVLYQMVEVIHCTEDALRLLRQLTHCDLNNTVTKPYVVREGTAAAAVEAPRGTLYYWVDIDAKGYIKNVNIITPTAQFLTHLEDDISAFIPGILSKDEKAMERKMRAFIRAYDPCISCAVH
ncbi:MAG: nickel-dependent hydrogenase large subunit [uncultured bacterium]|nr:MAG: nickel-dependent hydrogenase large subunit [uncultured bacterium]KKQ62755.1 MAG: nickel-dependent hydrogenase large subunit [Parcubacteria group bacterium GW2011_GWC1_38_22]